MCNANQVLAAPAVAPATGLFECARKSDGAAALIITPSTSTSASAEGGGGSAAPAGSVAAAPTNKRIMIVGGGEAAGATGLPEDKSSDALLRAISSASAAFRVAYADAAVLRVPFSHEL